MLLMGNNSMFHHKDRATFTMLHSFCRTLVSILYKPSASGTAYAMQAHAYKAARCIGGRLRIKYYARRNITRNVSLPPGDVLASGRWTSQAVTTHLVLALFGSITCTDMSRRWRAAVNLVGVEGRGGRGVGG